ncbi:hypothetical protein C815_00237 [Firmicutes bacterium M10-2]|nr:hypothetical protein C815_00237 [Firmicutes bacterium M10-2]
MNNKTKKHLFFFIELLAFCIAPIIETAKTPIILGQLYVLFFLGWFVIGWMYVSSLKAEEAQTKKLWILLGFGLLTIGYGMIVHSLLILIVTLVLMLIETILKKWL